MSAIATQFTIADLERMPDDGMHREVLDGELIELPPPKSVHSSIAMSFAESLLNYKKRNNVIAVRIEAGYKLFADRKNWLQPDVSVLAKERATKPERDGYYSGAPELAIEVISPSESASDVEGKTQAYFRAGAKAVVNVYPRQRIVRIHMPDGSARTLQNEPLRVPSLLPGWEMTLAEIFDGD